MNNLDHAMMLYYPPGKNNISVLNENRAYLAEGSNIRQGNRGFLYRNNHHVAYEEVMSRVRHLKRRVNHVLDDDIVEYRSTLGALQQSKRKMRNYIMAEPMVRRLYQREMLEGYGTLYKDYEADVPSDMTTSYIQATNGLCLINEDGDEVLTQWYDMEDELAFDEQCDIQHTWENVRMHLIHGLNDPTDPFNKIL